MQFSGMVSSCLTLRETRKQLSGSTAAGKGRYGERHRIGRYPQRYVLCYSAALHADGRLRDALLVVENFQVLFETIIACV